jgi:hypothetical protein
VNIAPVSKKGCLNFVFGFEGQEALYCIMRELADLQEND